MEVDDAPGDTTKNLDMLVTQAPRWKLMVRIELERFFEFPIIQAPKRNSKRHKEMWQLSVCRRPFARAVVVCATRDGAVTRGARVFRDGEPIPARRIRYQREVGIFATFRQSPPDDHATPRNI
jgi:hypothetical protein